LAAYARLAPADTPLSKLTRVAGRRWTSEDSPEEAKEVGSLARADEPLAGGVQG